MHINALELLVATLAVKSFVNNRRTIDIMIDVMIRTDNSTAMVYISHLGGTHSNVLNNLAKLSMRMSHGEEHSPQSRTSPRGREHHSRQEVNGSEEPAQLDDSSSSVCMSLADNGSVGGRHVCLMTDTPAA